MNNRLKELRINLNLSQEEFGTNIGIKSRAHISALESGSRNITDRIIKDIVRAYKVNENWLRYGEGDMLDTLSDDEEMMALIAKLCTDEEVNKRKVLTIAAKIIDNDVCWNIIRSELLKIVDSYKKE